MSIAETELTKGEALIWKRNSEVNPGLRIFTKVKLINLGKRKTKIRTSEGKVINIKTKNLELEEFFKLKNPDVMREIAQSTQGVAYVS